MHRLKRVRLIEQHRLDTREVALMDLPELLVQLTCERSKIKAAFRIEAGDQDGRVDVWQRVGLRELPLNLFGIVRACLESIAVFPPRLGEVRVELGSRLTTVLTPCLIATTAIIPRGVLARVKKPIAAD